MKQNYIQIYQIMKQLLQKQLIKNQEKLQEKVLIEEKEKKVKKK